VDDQREHGGEVFAERRAKLAARREAGFAYPTQYQPRDEIGPLHDAFRRLEAGQDSGVVHRVAGRVTARRVHGKLTFLVVKDASGEIQLFAQLDALGEERYAALEHVDLGDHVGAEGTVMRTRRGELSLRLTSWELLSKSLRPPPEKFHGLTDVETRYRKRYLDLMASDESRTVFEKRALISAASSRSRRRSCSRSTAGRWRGRSSPITTSSTATSTCASPPSCT
jgi:lysyl-tRNA synthetase class 2